MLDLIDGLPLHPLVVHAVVVLLPLACLGTLAIALRPAWRRRYGVLVLACAAAATALVPLATASGEELEKYVPDPEVHAERGEQLLWFAIPLLLAVAVLVWLDRRTAGTAHRADGPAGRGGLTRAVAAVAVLAALATSVQVYRVGESGAEAVWHDEVHSSR